MPRLSLWKPAGRASGNLALVLADHAAAAEMRERMNREDLAQFSINTIRTLSMDAVQKSKSGHPGTPMALAPLVYTIWNRVMRFDPKDPIWPNRDRFV